MIRMTFSSGQSPANWIILRNTHGTLVFYKLYIIYITRIFTSKRYTVTLLLSYPTHFKVSHKIQIITMCVWVCVCVCVCVYDCMCIEWAVITIDIQDHHNYTRAVLLLANIQLPSLPKHTHTHTHNLSRSHL